MKLLYITIDYDSYKKKIDGQLNAFVNNGIDAQLIAFNSKTNKIELLQFLDYKISVLNEKKLKKWRKREYFKFVFQCLERNKYDVIFIRRPGISILLCERILKKIENVDIKFIYEIPTYPFEDKSGIKGIVQTIEWKYTKKRVLPKADCVPVYCLEADCSLYSNMISVFNCVEFDLYKNLEKVELPFYDGSHLEIIGIAHYQSWHAYERILYALKEWENKPTISFTIFGKINSSTLKLIELCNKLEIDNVKFLEEKDIDDYLQFLSKFHIAIGSLGIHRRKNKKNKSILLDTSIKNKEYCAMGIPFVYSANDEAFPRGFQYGYQVEDNEKNIDMREIVVWFDNIYTEAKCRKNMMEFAKNNLSFDKYAQSVLKKID